MSRRESILDTFRAPRALIGMIHVGALPGTPGARMSVDEIVDQAIAEALVYRDAGFNALMIENMHDVPYLKAAVGPEITATMAVIAREMQYEVDLPLGIQILAGANREALAAAFAASARFIRVEGYVFGHVADEGWIEASAGPLMRFRTQIGAGNVRVFADIKKKHSAHAVTADVDLVETAKAAEFFRADGVIVTGSATGRPADADEVAAVAAAVGVPVFVGSGLTPDNLGNFDKADGYIVGSSVKHDGVWSNAIDRPRVEAVARAFERLPRLD